MIQNSRQIIGGEIRRGKPAVKKKAAELLEEMEQEYPDEAREDKKRKRFKFRFNWRILVLGLVIIIGLFGAGWLIFWNHAEDDAYAPLSESRPLWQAVFLTNGQVYFGHVISIDDNFLLIKNIYYLKPGGVDNGEIRNEKEERRDDANVLGTRLVKFGTEMHRPVDELRLNIQHVLMIEELSKESEVVQAIEEHEGE